LIINTTEKTWVSIYKLLFELIVQLQHKNFITQLIWFVIVVLIFALPDFFFSANPISSSKNTIYLELLQFSRWFSNKWIYNLIHLILLVSISIYAKYVFTYHQLIRRNNYLPAIFFIVFYYSSSSYDFQLLTIISIFLILLFFQNTLKNYDISSSEHIIFSAAFFLGLSTVLSYNNFIFLPLLWISFLIFHAYKWRNIPISLIAIIVPFLYLATYLYWTNNMDLIANELSAFSLETIDTTLPQGIFETFSMLLIAVLFIFSSLFFISNANSMTIAVRKKMTFVIWMSLFSLLLIYFFKNDQIANKAFIIPLSLLFGQQMEHLNKRKKPTNFGLGLTLLYFLFQRYYVLFHAQA
jgi:hypothetical protein